jgi:hypothetical protein
VIVNGGPGLVGFRDGKPFAVIGFAFARDRIVELDILAAPERLAQLDLSGV